MALVADEKIGRGNFFKPTSESLNGGDLNEQIELFRNTGADNAVLNAEFDKSFGGLFDKFLAMDEEDRAFAALKGLTDHPACHDSFTSAAGCDADDVFINKELVADVVDKFLLIGTKSDVHDENSFQKKCAKAARYSRN